jgi:dTDP-4-amino-4,6-dideoxygalactose transaminase
MILFANPLKAYEERKELIDSAIKRVLCSGRYVLGKEVECFEAEFSNWMGEGFSIGVANGTDAIELALRGLGVADCVRPAVFTVSHTAVATVVAIERAGATPVLVDVDEGSFTMSPIALMDAVEFVIKNRPDLTPFSVLPVHLYGHPCDMSALAAVARKFDLFLIEDCSQAHGALWMGKKVGTFGDAAAFSFYPTKNLGAFGDGGCVYTPSDQVADNIRALRQYGWRERYISVEKGINSRLDPIQAAILRVQLTHLDRDNERRRILANAYGMELSGVAGIKLPNRADGAEHVYHLYVIRVEGRDSFVSFMNSRGVLCAIHYPKAVHEQPAYCDCLAGNMGVTEEVCQIVVSLPMYPQITVEEHSLVCSAVKEWSHHEI